MPVILPKPDEPGQDKPNPTVIVGDDGFSPCDQAAATTMTMHVPTAYGELMVRVAKDGTITLRTEDGRTNEKIDEVTVDPATLVKTTK